ncbi:MAG: TolB family protein [Myxococcales bacterium]
MARPLLLALLAGLLPLACSNGEGGPAGGSAGSATASTGGGGSTGRSGSTGTGSSTGGQGSTGGGTGALPTDAGVSLASCGVEPNIAIFEDGGYATDWSYARNQLAYEKTTPDGYDNVFIVNPDGTGESSPTYQNPLLPGKNVGCPVWSPDGEYLVVDVEQAAYSGPASHATCGLGTYQDLWAITPDGQHVWQLTDVPTAKDAGTMLPRFSINGELMWTQVTGAPDILVPAKAFGTYSLQLAQFVVSDAGPSLQDIQTIAPVGSQPLGFYESGSFSPDGTRFAFTSILATNNAWSSQIFTIDLGDGGIFQLTEADGGYNEHPRYSPDGKTISWMSTTENTGGGTDWWLMNADGSNHRRLTYFNQAGNPESNGMKAICGTVAWDPTGSYFIGDLDYNLDYSTFRTLKVSCP